jgi:hypothetical protein
VKTGLNGNLTPFSWNTVFLKKHKPNAVFHIPEECKDVHREKPLFSRESLPFFTRKTGRTSIKPCIMERSRPLEGGHTKTEKNKMIKIKD